MNRSFGRAPTSSKKNLIIIIGGMTVAILLIVAVLVMLGGQKQQAAPKVAAVVQNQANEPTVKMVDVLIPVQTLDSGAELDPSMFRKELRPQVGVSSRVVRDFEEIQGQFAKSLIIAGQPLHKDYLTSTKPISSVSPRIPDGFRAIAINVNSTSAVEGWAQPGSKVDVSWTSSVNGKPSISIIVQNAKILSAQKNTNPNSDPNAPVPTTVTLLVSAADAQRIQLAQTSGTLNLQLRGDPDTGRVNVGENTITTDELLESGNNDGDADRHGTVIMGGREYCFSKSKTLKPKTSSDE